MIPVCIIGVRTDCAPSFVSGYVALMCVLTKFLVCHTFAELPCRCLGRTPHNSARQDRSMSVTSIFPCVFFPLMPCDHPQMLHGGLVNLAYDDGGKENRVHSSLLRRPGLGAEQMSDEGEEETGSKPEDFAAG